MATNPPSGDGNRNGAVKGRSQTFNPKTEQWVKRNPETGPELMKTFDKLTEQWVKRNPETGRFMDVKKDCTPFKGVRKEK